MTDNAPREKCCICGELTDYPEAHFNKKTSMIDWYCTFHYLKMLAEKKQIDADKEKE